MSTVQGPTAVGSVAAKASELRRLELLVTRRLDGLLTGEFIGALPGPGTEPAGARPYVAGDDARRIDWNLTARSVDAHVRNTDADRELETWIVLDRSASLDFGTTEREKRDVAFAAVAAFSFLAARNGNRTGLLVAGGDDIVRLPPATTRTALMATLSKLYDLPRNERPAAPGADLAATLERLAQMRTRRGQVVVISDFLDASDWSRPLRQLTVRHEVLAVHVEDPRELSLPAVGMATIVDIETGRTIDLQTNSASLRDKYARAAAERHDRITNAVRASGGEYVALATDRDWLIDIVRFITTRRRTLRRGARQSVTLAASASPAAARLRSVP